MCQWPLTLISCFKCLHHVCNLQYFIWVWWQLPLSFIICDNLTILWQEPFYSNWYYSVRKWTGCPFCCTSATILARLFLLEEKDVSHNCWDHFSCCVLCLTFDPTITPGKIMHKFYDVLVISTFEGDQKSNHWCIRLEIPCTSGFWPRYQWPGLGCHLAHGHL